MLMCECACLQVCVCVWMCMFVFVYVRARMCMCKYRCLSSPEKVWDLQEIELQVICEPPYMDAKN